MKGRVAEIELPTRIELGKRFKTVGKASLTQNFRDLMVECFRGFFCHFELLRLHFNIGLYAFSIAHHCLADRVINQDAAFVRGAGIFGHNIRSSERVKSLLDELINGFIEIGYIGRNRCFIFYNFHGFGAVRPQPDFASRRECWQGIKC
jgi:hypothetical protein